MSQHQRLIFAQIRNYTTNQSDLLPCGI